jgi:hypothetical protein
MTVAKMLAGLLDERLIDLLKPEHRAAFAEYLARADINRMLPGPLVDEYLARVAGHLLVEERNARFDAVKAAVLWRQTTEDTGDTADVQRACAEVDNAVHALIDPSSLGCLPPAAEATTGGHA